MTVTTILDLIPLHSTGSLMFPNQHTPHRQQLTHTTLVALKKASCGLVGWHWCLWKEPVMICGKWNVRQAMLQQMFKVTTFCTDTCFQFLSPLINCIVHRVLMKSSLCRNKTLPQLIRIADLYSTSAQKIKRWKVCAFYKVTRWHFSGVVGKAVSVCFLLR